MIYKQHTFAEQSQQHASKCQWEDQQVILPTLIALLRAYSDVDEASAVIQTAMKPRTWFMILEWLGDQ